MANLTPMRRSESRRTLRKVAMAFALMACATRVGVAQGASQLDLGGAVLPGGEEMLYVRALALADSAALPSLIQPLSAQQERALRIAAGIQGPWQQRFAAADGLAQPRAFAGINYQLLRPDAGLVYHSGLPLSRNDGPVWAGRGATLHGTLGVRASWGPVHLQVAPVLYATQNAAFELADNGTSDQLRFGDARFPESIDVPQRFGDGRVARLDAGESSLRLEGLGVNAGLSTARLSWGPAREHNLVMSTNAGGFLHAFAGTQRPWNLWVGTVEARLIGGRLAQSSVSPVDSGPADRFTSALIGRFSPRGAPWLELGAIRVMQVRWPDGGPSLSQVLRPLQTVISDPNEGADPNQNTENQFAAVFTRIAVPGSGLEVYAEFSREDFAGNTRWLIAEPDDLSALMLGVARSVRGSGGRLSVLRAELVHGETSHSERGDRGLTRPIPSYTHHQTRQGLTNRGQILGSVLAYGGSGGTVTYERYHEAGRERWSVERQLRLDWLPTLGSSGTRHAEVMYALRFDVLRFVGAREWGFTVAPAYVLNRNLERGNDLFSLELGLRWRGW